MIYSKEVPETKTPGNTSIYRHPKYVNGLKFRPAENIATLKDSFLNSVLLHGKNSCLGTLNANKTGYTWKTYEEIKLQAEQIGSGIINLNLAPETNEYENLNLRLIGVYSKNREEWVTLDIANCLYRATMIPLYDTLGPETISFVIGHSNIQTLFVASSDIANLWKSEPLFNLKNIVCFDNKILEQDLKIAKDKNINILTWEDVLNEGRKNIQPYAQVNPKDCFTFSYTSGTTGNPKGAMLSHENMIAVLSSVEETSIKLCKTDVHLSYLPLPHIFERLVVCSLLYYGAAIGFFGGDVLKLKDDLQVLKPSLFVSVPRLYNKFYSRIKGGMDEQKGCKKCLIEKATNSKMQALHSNAQYQSGLWDALVFKKSKAVMGGNVTRMIVGSAPISSTILDFMKIAMCCPFIEGYGQTESTGASFCTDAKDPVSGHVGGPVCSVEFKLQDVPDMGYTSQDIDKETGKPAPRGEICIRGFEVFLGYYKDREKTNEAIDQEGWLHTGDVGTIQSNGSLKIIDRKKNIFKLSQGEYVSPEKVENIYIRAKGVAECFLHGDSLQHYAVAIVVPDQDALVEIAKENNLKNDKGEDVLNIQELIRHPKINEIILRNMTNLGKQEGLKGFEQAKRIHLVPNTFSEQGCMTNTMKLQRHLAKVTFKQPIDEMYALGDPAEIKK